jgi:Flp pilus assembly protein TadG
MRKESKNREKINRNERGQSLVELAISFMVIMFLLSGAVDLGRAFFTYVAIRDAAQEGATYASTNPTDTASIHTRAQQSSDSPVDFASDPNITFKALEFSGAWCSGFYLDGGDIKANAVTVTIWYQFPISMALMQPIVQAITGANYITLKASSTYTIISPACSP